MQAVLGGREGMVGKGGGGDGGYKLRYCREEGVGFRI